MSVRASVAVLLAGLLGILATGATPPTPTSRGGEPAPRLPEIGERGTLVATLAGGTPEEIPVRYLGAYRNYAGPGRDVHLVQMEGERGEQVGAANGMSGSPVYFDGRLLGALAYRMGAFPKSPVAGVTPIGDMLDVARASGPPPGEAAGDMRPIATPVMLGGVADRVREWAAPHLAELGFAVQAAGGGVGTAEPASTDNLAAGLPVGVQLVRGDLRIAATGTVTRVDGDTVYAFGHPFLGTGRVEMPMAAAEVIHTLADWSGSFHMVNLGPSVGAVLEDRQSGIVGRLGQQARMIPVQLHVRGGDYVDEFHRFEVVAHSRLTPLLTGIAAANSLAVSHGYSDEMTVMARGTLRLRDLPDLPLEMAFSSSQGFDPVSALAGTLFAAVQNLWSNPIGEVEVEGLDLELDVRPAPLSYTVESVHYDRGRLEPGQTLGLRCVLREHRGGTRTRELELELPERLPRKGSLILAVSSPAGINQVLGDPLGRRLGTAKELDAVVHALAERRSSHRLTAVVYDRGGTVVTRGTTFTDLPPTAEKLLSLGQSRPEAGARPLVAVLARAEVELDGPLEGGLQLRLNIDRGFAGENR